MNNQNSHSSLVTLDEWLFYLESIHSTEIDMGLDRISKVASKLQIDLSKSNVITVSGTNGKGTTCAFLEHALLDIGHSVAVYSSPHIERFNERLRINKSLVDDAPLIDAFKTIEATRGDISLTYYEYTTLAALMICQQQRPDYILLEVGLGGRLDATNIIDADIAVITSIDLDHQAFLGDTRDAIGYEKAGIARADTPLVIGDGNCPESVRQFAASINARCYLRGIDFDIVGQSLQQPWTWVSSTQTLSGLGMAKIPRDNVATALQVLTLLNVGFDIDKVNQWLSECQLEGRLQTLSKAPHVIVDVAHNPHAARYLASFVHANRQARVLAVTAMLKDKDIENTLKAMYSEVDQWYVASLPGARGESAQRLSAVLTQDSQLVNSFDNVKDAFKMALKDARKNDMVLIFGSFFTVAEINKNLPLLDT
ncbi:bifunctional tetrahydrofolate synthase/dihydrofolate synthase [Thalassotalea ponticola]|uniref:bifunctional tetrahydrofolate synthase/dihydrofolate synthase n=1 Tax=Thalassotalea ponticola TaxID=1523392 RepID=UPI0025B31B74|nr:bifunctional tetrahydrofolate synthase/dihydrofolate synthase [Thalassotalea ponticola]MDN3653161.1 bifunctional tetrahydrofolate synthase/dihydrofolate synthase [Thalassotalea ponticola]